MIGNYGVNSAEDESPQVQAAGLIVKEYVPYASNFNSQMNLHDYLQKHKTPGLQGIDTRRLILLLRNEGAQNGGIFPAAKYNAAMLKEVRALPAMEGLDLIANASDAKPYYFGEQSGKRFRLAVLDFGIKRSILQILADSGFAVRVFPARTTFHELQAEDYDCYFLSNGPGDPGALDYAVTTAKAILASAKPVFGICLGHQLIGLARGRKRFKLKFGHRGANQPVQQVANGRVEITSQNHGFAIQKETQAQNVTKNDMSATHTNLNDNTIEGFYDPTIPMMCVQHHPEASPGPHDSRYLFREFFELVERHYSPNHDRP